MAAKERKRGGSNMAIMTADCKKSFSVSSEKAMDFKAKKCSKHMIKKIDAATAKLEKNLKVNIGKK